MRPRGQAASLAKRSGLQVLWHQTSELLQAHLSCIALGHDAELRHVAFRQGQQLGVAAAVQGSGLTKHAASKGLYACDSLECSKWVRYDGLILGEISGKPVGLLVFFIVQEVRQLSFQVFK